MKSSLTEKWIVCRCCLKQPKESMQVIFDKNDDKDLTRMIFECGGVPIKRFDHYPDKICDKCLKYLRVAYKFRVTCQRSHKHLSRFIAPVVVDKTSAADSDGVMPDLTVDLDGVEEVTLKLEPEDVMNIKQEFLNIEDGEVVDVYEPMDEDADFEDLPDLDVSEPSAMNHIVDDIEYIEDFVDEVSTSDEEYVPHAKCPPKKSLKSKMLRATQQQKSQKPTTSQKALAAARASKAIKSAGKTAKKEPKPKRVKESAFICDVCGNIYPSQGRLTEHIKLHKGIKPHECEICGHAFAQVQQLARHMNTHTGNRPYKCSYCPAAFADLSTRNKHHRIHTNERPYVCDVCGKAFTYTNTLKFHKMIHTGEKPFVCEICGKGFQQAYKLRNHKMTHEKKGVKLERIEVETLPNYQEVHVAATQILEI